MTSCDIVRLLRVLLMFQVVDSYFMTILDVDVDDCGKKLVCEIEVNKAQFIHFFISIIRQKMVLKYRLLFIHATLERCFQYHTSILTLFLKYNT